MQWYLQPTLEGCQLIVDGQPIGSPAEPPPSGWLQRQYGILMPLEYEQMREMCNVSIHLRVEQCEEVPTYRGGCPPGMAPVGTVASEDGEDLDWLCCPPGGYPPLPPPGAVAIAGYLGGAERQCETTYDGGVRRTHCADGSGSIDLYRLNEELDAAGWATYEIPVDASMQERAASMAEVMRWWIESGQAGTDPPGQGSAFYRIAQAYNRAHGFAGGRPCPTREDFLPYCDPCTQPLCGDVILPDCPMFGPDHPDCQRPPRVQVDPHARVRAVRAGYESQRAWMDAGGEGIVPDDWADAWLAEHGEAV